MRNSILKIALVPFLGLGGVTAAFAQAAPAFTASVTSASTSIASYGASLVGIAAVGVTFMIAMKYVKKIRSAA